MTATGENVECMIRHCDEVATTSVTLERVGGPKTGVGGGGYPALVEGVYCYPHAFRRMTDPEMVPGHELEDFGDTWTFRPLARAGVTAR
ncbi:hypothetical protein [Microbacterium sp. NPDC080220]|uniref:hypothetical protein n=1 Tax=Microbacterium sp. NPDC080220 TaxID=3161017 RepID=UPI003440FF35